MILATVILRPDGCDSSYLPHWMIVHLFLIKILFAFWKVLLEFHYLKTFRLTPLSLASSMVDQLTLLTFVSSISASSKDCSE